MSEQQKFEALCAEFSQDGKLISPRSLLQRAANKWPDKIALITDGERLTYEQLYARAAHLTALLITKGIKPGERVCVLFSNSIEFYVAYYGAWQAGAVIIPLNTFLTEVEITKIVAHAQPSLLIGQRERLEKLQTHVATLSENDFPPIGGSLPHIVIPHEELNALATLPYTSGTTGFPKGVMLSSRNIMSNVLQAVARIKIHGDERVFAILPLFHSFAQVTCVWGAIAVGASIIIVPKIERRTITEGLRHRPTIFMGVPALYGVLILMKTADLSSVRYFVCGGDALPDNIRAGFELVYRRKLCNGYGLTEASPVIAAELHDELLPTNCIGRPVVDVECSLRTEQGTEVAPGEIGILWVRGPNIMLGYYNAPEQTAAALKDGWLDTGDFARIDAEGRLYICGRFKDLIIHRGINIYPQEIENVLLTHPAVTMAAVVGKPDPMVGELPVAFVLLRTPIENPEETLREWCIRSLAMYKVPKNIFVLDKMPLTAMGKVDKKKLVAELNN